MKRTLMSCAVASLLVSGSALAAWPEKPIQIIVPWGAGGNTDTVARLVAEGLQKRVESECQRGESHGRCWGGWP